MMKNRENRFFFGVLLIILVVGAFTMIKNPETYSDAERRLLAQFPHLTIGGFIDGSFQDSFESAFADQFFASNEIRTNYYQAMANTPKFGLDQMFCKNRYMEQFNSKDGRRATYNCEDYIVSYPDYQPLTQRDGYPQSIESFNYLNSISDVYYYYINDSSAIDFTTNKKLTNYSKLRKEDLKGNYHLTFFDFKDFNEYKEYFYKTDHHWNYKGSYKGYQDIMKMLGASKALEPKGTFTEPIPSFGSHARTTKNYDYPEEFSMYVFDIPDHDTFIDGEEKTYNHIKECLDHDYKDKGEFVDFYNYCYGTNYTEVIFDYHQEQKENLLIIANSFGNPIDELIAASYNKTFVIDPRGHDFSMKSYIEENDIDKVLVIFNDVIKITKGIKE